MGAIAFNCSRNGIEVEGLIVSLRNSGIRISLESNDSPATRVVRVKAPRSLGRSGCAEIVVVIEGPKAKDVRDSIGRAPDRDRRANGQSDIIVGCIELGDGDAAYCGGCLE